MRALTGLWKAIAISVSMALVSSLTVLVFAEDFAACFDANPEVVRQSAAFLRVTYGHILFAAVGPLIGFIRGTGNLEASLLVGVLAQLCGRIPASFLFGALLGFPGVGVAVLVGPDQCNSLSVVYSDQSMAPRTSAYEHYMKCTAAGALFLFCCRRNVFQYSGICALRCKLIFPYTVRHENFISLVQHETSVTGYKFYVPVFH